SLRASSHCAPHPLPRPRHALPSRVGCGPESDPSSVFMIELSTAHIARFHEDGFLILDRFLGADEAARVAARFERLFRGEFETGLQPDEWNWREGRDRPDLARQICNGWRADYTGASLVLSAEVGRLCAQLAGWPGARLPQDNVIWKPPGARPLGFPQDASYNGWIDVPRPPHML